MDISTLRPGDAVELLVDANAIPAGCYRFLELQGEIIVLTVGHEVIIGLAYDFWSKFMRPASESGAALTSEKKFARNYCQLLANVWSRLEISDPTRMTFCMISERVMRKGEIAMRHHMRPVADPHVFN